MNADLGFSPSVYGMGTGIFFISYGLFQVPSNLALHKVGARLWIFLIVASWGAASAGTAFIHGETSFYSMRFLLGVAEAGLVPGAVLYMTSWFPKAWLCRVTAMFMCASVVAPVIGGPLASTILRLDGVLGVQGWRWLFVIEALPPFVIAAAVLAFLPDRPASATWLTAEEKLAIKQHIGRDDTLKEHNLVRALCDPRVLLLGIGYGLFLVAGYGLSFWTPLVLQQAGFSNSATGVLTALIFIAGVPAMILWARRSDQREERIWHAATAALLISTALAMAAAAPNAAVLVPALAAAVIGDACFLAPNYGIPALFLTGPAMAGGFALMNAIGNLLGGFAGQYAIGLLRQQTGNYIAAFVALSASTLLTAIIVLAVGRSIAPRMSTRSVPVA
jgi:ACS family tartrate transporter-like MFS transporter